jgi:hypothetical protein
MPGFQGRRVSCGYRLDIHTILQVSPNATSPPVLASWLPIEVDSFLALTPQTGENKAEILGLTLHDFPEDL